MMTKILKYILCFIFMGFSNLILQFYNIPHPFVICLAIIGIYAAGEVLE